MEPIKYTLREPIEFGTETITELTFKPMKAKHLRTLGTKRDLGDLISIASVLAGITKEEMDEVSAKDTLAIIEIISGFLVDGQPTGANA